MDLREQLLPSEKLLNEYKNLLIENKKGTLYLTNLRIFLSTKNNLWNFNTEDILYMGRMNNPRFSWIWQVLISIMMLFSITSGKTLLFLIFMILSAARQYLKIDCLEIGLESKKWIISDDHEQLDELMLQIQTNQVTGLQKGEGKPIVDAEEELDRKIEVNIVGENESGPLRSAWISISFAFIFYYLN